MLVLFLELFFYLQHSPSISLSLLRSSPRFVLSNSESFVGVGVLFSLVTFLSAPGIIFSLELCPVQYAPLTGLCIYVHATRL